MPFLCHGAQLFEDFLRRADAHISGNQNFFEFIIKVIVHFAGSVEQIVQAVNHGLSGLFKSRHETAEKSLFLFCHCSSYLSSWSSMRLTETSAETPFSCIVMP